MDEPLNVWLLTTGWPFNTIEVAHVGNNTYEPLYLTTLN